MTNSLLPTSPDSQPSRRDFLATAGAAAVTLASSPLIEAPFVHADDKSGSKLPVVGVDGHQYSCQHGWGRFPITSSGRKRTA